MSVEALAYVIAHSRAVGNARLVLMALAEGGGSGDDEGLEVRFSTISTFANIADRDAVRDALADLVTMRELDVYGITDESVRCMIPDLAPRLLPGD